MERIAILDHDLHQLYLEDIDEDILNDEYGGEEERYIEDNYDIKNYSWEYIVKTLYYGEDELNPVEVEFTNLIEEGHGK